MAGMKGKTMTKDQAIEYISLLYPADSEYAGTAKIGQKLLEQAKREINNWRNEPEPVLIRYAQLCAKFEHDQEIAARRKKGMI